MRVKWLEKQLFGKKSERLDPDQPELFKEGSEMGKPEPPLDSEKASEREEEDVKRKQRKRRTKDELGLRNLPVIEKARLKPKEVTANPSGFKKIGERYHDELDYVPGRMQWQRTVIEEFVSLTDDTQPPLRETAPAPMIPGTMITASLAADMIINKHCDHLPHYRQACRYFREQSVQISHKTINKWVHAAASHLAPIAASIGQELRSSNLLQVDETPMDYLQPGCSCSFQGYIWVMRCPKSGATYYHWEARRNNQALLNLLGYGAGNQEHGFKGVIQCDGYSCYESFRKAYDGIALATCMAHIRRKFLEDEGLILEPWVAYLLKAIKALYRIERRLRRTNALPDQVKRTRLQYAQPILIKLKQLLLDRKTAFRPSSSGAKAVNYALSQWTQLENYLKNGDLPIDNNGVENAIRPCKLGLKNYLFFGSLEAGVNNTVLYTLIENCKAVGINVRDYLVYVIEALHVEQPEDLTPAKIAQKWDEVAA